MTEDKIQAIREYRKAFLQTGEIHPDIRTAVADSWRRCEQYDLATNYKVNHLSTGELQRLLDSHSRLMSAAHPILRKMVSLVEGTQYAISLHDKDGYILDCLFAGDHPVLSLSSLSGFNPGACWNEQTLGTCSTSLCLQLDQEIQVVGAEHYSEKLGSLVGSSAPIHGEDGNLIGCLNAFGGFHTSSPHTLALVKGMAMLIESQLALASSRQMIKDTFDLMSDGLIILDEQLGARQVSFHAAAILQMPQKSVYGLDFQKILSKSGIAERIRLEAATLNEPEFEWEVGGRTIICSTTVTPMYSRKRFTGAILTLREIQRINRLANHVMGNKASYSFDDIITQSSAVFSQIKMMKGIASTDCCVLIEGESGTGKELFAHALHNAGNRRTGPFVAVNCSSLPRSLVASELFGYEKGAFTGARSEGNPGKFELADGGTSFLDEIGELPLEIQATLLRVLDNHRVVRIGGKSEKLLDVRVVAASNRNLYQEVKNGNFRNDLYCRINVLKFDIPPRRDRDGDTLLLAQIFLDQMNQKQEQGQKSFSEEFMSALCRYDWPGNVRELQNVVVRAFYASAGKTIMMNDLPQHILTEIARKKMEQEPHPQLETHAEDLRSFERQKIVEALAENGGDVIKAGVQLGLSKSTIYRRIRQYQISLK